MRFFLGVVASLLVAALAGVGHASAGGDPDLEPGFPVQAFETARHVPQRAGGSCARRQHRRRPDARDPCERRSPSGPLYAWNADGSPQPGWPAEHPAARPMPALGAALDLGSPASRSSRRTSDNVFSRRVQRRRRDRFPAGPARAPTTSPRPPSLADVDGDGLDEIFIEEAGLGAAWIPRERDRSPGLAGQRRRRAGACTRLPSAISTATAMPEIVSVSGWTSPGVYVHAYHRDGSEVAGFPVLMDGEVDTFPAIGDVDGDGAPEIVRRGLPGSHVVRQGAGGGRDGRARR